MRGCGGASSEPAQVVMLGAVLMLTSASTLGVPRDKAVSTELPELLLFLLLFRLPTSDFQVLTSFSMACLMQLVDGESALRIYICTRVDAAALTKKVDTNSQTPACPTCSPCCPSRDARNEQPRFVCPPPRT